MRELAILSFVTLDGVMQSPTSPEEDASGGFSGGGWGAPYWEEVMPQVYAEAMSEPYDLLFGRKTYDVFASHWPHVDAEAGSCGGSAEWGSQVRGDAVGGASVAVGGVHSTDRRCCGWDQESQIRRRAVDPGAWELGV